MSSVAATLPDPHPSPANTLSVCGRRRRRRRMGEEEERTSEGTVQVPYPSFCFEQTSGAEGSERGDDGDEMFSQKDSLLPSTFPQ